MDGIAQVRSFNRVVTQQIGALAGGFLGRTRSLGACRVLFEIGKDGIEIRQLRARLALDSGYTSRLLRHLEAERLIRTKPSPRDTRVRFVTLTTPGRKELAVLNRLSDEAARSLLHPLPEPQRAALLAAMGTVERLLRSGAVRLSGENPASPAARYCLARYFDELGARFEAGFETRPELVEVARKTVARRRTSGVLSGEAHGATPQQALDGPHGGEQGGTLRFREGVEERPGSLVRQPIQDRQLFEARGSEGYETHARVARRWLGADQSLRLEVSQQSARVARVQGQTGTQLSDLDPVLPDLK